MKFGRTAWWLIGAALASGFFLGGAAAKDSSLFGQTVAAWIQAIGSIAAIIGAIAIERGTARREAAARREAVRAKLAACSRLVTMFRIKCAAALEGRTEEGRHNTRFGEPVIQGFRGLAAMLRTFPIAEIPDPRAVVAFTDAIETADLIVTFLTECDGVSPGRSDEAIRLALEFQVKHLTEFTTRIVECDDRLRGIAGL